MIITKVLFNFLINIFDMRKELLDTKKRHCLYLQYR